MYIYSPSMAIPLYYKTLLCRLVDTPLQLLFNQMDDPVVFCATRPPHSHAQLVLVFGMVCLYFLDMTGKKTKKEKNKIIMWQKIKEKKK